MLTERFGPGHRCTVSATATVTLTAPDRVDTMGRVIHAAHEAGIELADVGLRTIT